MADKRAHGPISSFESLKVYRKLVRLHLEVNEITMKFPKYEMYELGAQLRRSSNSRMLHGLRKGVEISMSG